MRYVTIDRPAKSVRQDLVLWSCNEKTSLDQNVWKIGHSGDSLACYDPFVDNQLRLEQST
jgi:hypothetical protein